MISISDITNYLMNNVAPGTTLSVQNIQHLISSHFTLTHTDLQAYVNTRKTSYPKWHSQIQKALYFMTKNNKIIHVSKGYYTF